jgi:hypothetical protein
VKALGLGWKRKQVEKRRVDQWRRKKTEEACFFEKWASYYSTAGPPGSFFECKIALHRNL